MKDLIYSISAANIADILIIAGFAYAILAWFKGTRAFQILFTMVGMGILYLAASKLGLVMTSVFFQYLWAAFIIVLAIVFQPELREMLERASPAKYINGRAGDAIEYDVINEVVKAVGEMARLRVGALIVFRREHRLEDLLLQGKQLDALVSAEILLTIFNKNSPLHDGAVIIVRNKVRAAACILPLSIDQSLDGRYGTRHRAAVGLTERSDAVCLVVSEERGEVSLVEGGGITLYKSKSDLRRDIERCMDHGGPSEIADSRGLTGLFTANWRLKAASLFSALVLWLIMVGPQTSEIGIQVPIQYTNLPSGLEISGKWMDRIDVRVRGSESSLANLKSGEVRAAVDLNRVVTGLNYFRLSRRSIQVPPGVMIAGIRPSDLHLNIVAASVRKVQVSVNLVGEPPTRTRAAVSPTEVTVRGVQEDLERLKSVITDPVKVSELMDKGKILVPVSVQPSGLRIDAVEPLQVTVSLEGQGS
ncbi:MAG: diadenylate cyclase CdaA [Pseudomonadota bacterium]